MPGRDPGYRNELVWLDASHAWLIGGHGAVAIDLARGAYGPAATGWQFELGRAPHPTGELGRPVVADVASGRDGPFALSGDAAFQDLVSDVTLQTQTRVLWWGAVRFDGAPHRTALVQSREIDADTLFAALIELAPDQIVAVAIRAWGITPFQGPYPDDDPAWGTALGDDILSEIMPRLDLPALEVTTRWIHGSFARLAFTVERGQVVVVAHSWMERDNNGHGYDTTQASKAFPAGHRPLLETYQAHAMRIAIVGPEHAADALAVGIRRLPRD
jgi:hypothetical protein